jgi:hypothetical protein
MSGAWGPGSYAAFSSTYLDMSVPERLKTWGQDMISYPLAVDLTLV